jgi:hypothetical protein
MVIRKVIAVFKRMETFYPAKSNTADMKKLHGFEGPIKVNRPSQLPLLAQSAYK